MIAKRDEYVLILDIIQFFLNSPCRYQPLSTTCFTAACISSPCIAVTSLKLKKGTCIFFLFFTTFLLHFLLHALIACADHIYLIQNFLEILSFVLIFLCMVYKSSFVTYFTRSADGCLPIEFIFSQMHWQNSHLSF